MLSSGSNYPSWRQVGDLGHALHKYWCIFCVFHIITIYIYLPKHNYLVWYNVLLLWHPSIYFFSFWSSLRQRLFISLLRSDFIISSDKTYPTTEGPAVSQYYVFLQYILFLHSKSFTISPLYYLLRECNRVFLILSFHEKLQGERLDLRGTKWRRAWCAFHEASAAVNNRRSAKPDWNLEVMEMSDSPHVSNYTSWSYLGWIIHKRTSSQRKNDL